MLTRKPRVGSIYSPVGFSIVWLCGEAVHHGTDVVSGRSKALTPLGERVSPRD